MRTIYQHFFELKIVIIKLTAKIVSRPESEGFFVTSIVNCISESHYPKFLRNTLLPFLSLDTNSFYKGRSLYTASPWGGLVPNNSQKTEVSALLCTTVISTFPLAQSIVRKNMCFTAYKDFMNYNYKHFNAL